MGLGIRIGDRGLGLGIEDWDLGLGINIGGCGLTPRNQNEMGDMDWLL